MKMKTKVIANFTSPSKPLSIIFVAEFFDNRDSSVSVLQRFISIGDVLKIAS